MCLYSFLCLCKAIIIKCKEEKKKRESERKNEEAANARFRSSLTTESLEQAIQEFATKKRVSI